MFGTTVESAARAHALAAHPKESCGLVVAGAYLPQPNIAADPLKQFQMPADAFTAHGEIQGVIHSHGAGEALAPSAADIQGQMASGVPWGIVRCDGTAASPLLWWGDFRLNEPLIGRIFVHGVADCYSAIRSWYWQRRQIKLRDFPRDDQWWSDDRNLYAEGFPQAGFRTVPESEVAVGDVALITFRSKVPNHGGVLDDEGLFYHHLQGRLSCREPLGRWRALITTWLRYEG